MIGDIFRVRVWCRASCVRLGGRRDGCRWTGYRQLRSARRKPCPACGGPVALVGDR